MPLPEVHVGQEDTNNLHGDTGTYSFHLMNELNQSPGQASWAAESKAGRVQAHAGSDQEGLAGTHRPKQSRERPARTNEDREDRTQGVLAYFARGVF